MDPERGPLTEVVTFIPQQRVSLRKIAWGGSLAVRVLLLIMVAFVTLYGCDQEGSAVEKQEKQTGVEEAKPKEPKEPTEQATVKCEDFSSREGAQEYLDTRATNADRKVIDPDDNGRACDEGAYLFASEPTTTSSAYASASGFSMPPEEQAAQSEANCRLVTYVSEEGMSQQEGSDLSFQVAERMADEMVDDPSLTAGPAQNRVLDDLGVARYPECKVGEE